MREYYEARAGEYDDWWLGSGLFAQRERPGWFEEVLGVAGVLASLPAARTLDVACGTGFLTKFLHGEVTGLDQSESMLRLAASHAPNARFMQGDALALPFPAAAFDRLVAGHFYGHLEDGDRVRFLAEAHRVAGELVIVDVRPPGGSARHIVSDARTASGSGGMTATGAIVGVRGGIASNPGGDSILFVPFSGGPLVVLVAFANGGTLGNGIATDGTFVYYSGQDIEGNQGGVEATPLNAAELAS
jgi:SAM-dependent methyltransferase